MKTMGKHVKWRKDNGYVFVCDCKRLLDFKLPLRYARFMEKLSSGVEPGKLSKTEALTFSDLEKTGLLADLEARPLVGKDFPAAMKLLKDTLGDKMTRTPRFLKQKHREFPDLFIGLFLGGDIIGFICGFPRDDYILLSEIAVDRRFRHRGFATLLARAFEKAASRLHAVKEIRVGAQDDAVPFYVSLGYKPFLLIQFPKGRYNEKDFKTNRLRILRSSPGIVEAVVTGKPDMRKIAGLRKELPKASFQYIFTKI
jgi:GNAT superfamily N-acetyltransferase